MRLALLASVGLHDSWIGRRRPHHPASGMVLLARLYQACFNSDVLWL
jgi:hypothetical protein